MTTASAAAMVAASRGAGSKPCGSVAAGTRTVSATRSPPTTRTTSPANAVVATTRRAGMAGDGAEAASDGAPAPGGDAPLGTPGVGAAVDPHAALARPSVPAARRAGMRRCMAGSPGLAGAAQHGTTARAGGGTPGSIRSAARTRHAGHPLGPRASCPPRRHAGRMPAVPGMSRVLTVRGSWRCPPRRATSHRDATPPRRRPEATPPRRPAPPPRRRAAAARARRAAPAPASSASPGWPRASRPAPRCRS